MLGMIRGKREIDFDQKRRPFHPETYLQKRAEREARFDHGEIFIGFTADGLTHSSARATL